MLLNEILSAGTDDARPAHLGKPVPDHHGHQCLLAGLDCLLATGPRDMLSSNSRPAHASAHRRSPRPARPARSSDAGLAAIVLIVRPLRQSRAGGDDPDDVDGGAWSRVV